MKIQHLIPILVLAGICTVSAQTNNTPAITSTPSLLTTNQVASRAIQLANDRYIKDHPVGLQPKFWTKTQQFNAGHWIWNGIWSGHADAPLSDAGWYMATVELAPDGSTNSVEVRYFSTHN